MQRFFKTVSIFILSMALTCPVVEGRGRNNNNGNHGSPSHRTERPARPGNQGQRPGNQGQRPGGNHGNSNPGNRPGGNHGNNNPGNRPGGNHGNNNPGNRPGGNHGNSNPGNRPGGNHGNNNPGNRPGGNHQGVRPGNQGHRPGQNPGHRPDPGYRPNPGHRPGHNPGPRPGHGFRPGPGGPSWGHLHYGRPHRPMMPPPRPWHRPVPPPSFRPYHGAPVISTILGITIGTAINATINSLLNRGFAVTGYSDNAVYINNVTQLNLLWPAATLHYNDIGGLAASEFMYSTPYYDMARYNIAYQSLLGNYGAPASVNQLSGGGVQANWWGNNGQFISLSFGPQYATNGSMRYYTTLSFGN